VTGVTTQDETQTEILGEIDETRREMGSTLNELGDRLTPGHLVDQAKENVREATVGRLEDTARGMSDMVFETIKRNPIPTAMAGMGLAMLWRNRTQPTSDTGYRGSHHPGLSPTSYFGDQQQDLGSKVSGVASKAGDAASTVGAGVGGAASSIAEGAQQATGEVVDRAGAAAQEVGWKLDSFMQANPLAMGAIAVGAGAVIGSLLPETDPERELLGDASRQVGTKLTDVVDEATAKAEETFDNAEAKLTSSSA
jgi:ElaB/YqjD/DUF883 family membrane-anchored ribosome-binding protein